jgi:tetratricopeptide (TPR) repeat protein
VEEQGKAYQGIGLNYLGLSKLDSPHFNFENALSNLKSINSKKLVAGAFIDLGNVLLEETKYKESLNYFIEAEKLYKSE